MFSSSTKIGGLAILLIIAVVILSLLVLYYRRKSKPKKSSFEHSVKYTPNEIESDEEDDVNRRVWRPDFVTSPAVYPTSKDSKSDPSTSVVNRNPNHPMSKNFSNFFDIFLDEYVTLGAEDRPGTSRALNHSDGGNLYETIPSYLMTNPNSFGNPNAECMEPLLPSNGTNTNL
jgi:hypothetical protein